MRWTRSFKSPRRQPLPSIQQLLTTPEGRGWWPPSTLPQQTLPVSRLLSSLLLSLPSSRPARVRSPPPVSAPPPSIMVAGGYFKAAIVLALVIGVGSWLYAEVQPPKPRPCGSEGGPPVTAPRIRLRDGRFLAYSETGVPKERARYKIIFCHGFSSSRLDVLRPSPELVEELGVYMVGYDRAGHAESDPNPRRSLRSEASDIAELADKLKLGPRLYLVGFSLGCHAVWASIKYIPGRLAGAALLAPVINYRWPGFPKDLARETYNKQQLGDQWALRIAYHAPWLLHWWMKQSWLPTSTVIKGTPNLPNRLDAWIHNQSKTNRNFEKRMKLATQQGIQESFYRDMQVMFGKWEFDPMDLLQPSFPVHLWHGDEDGLVPVSLQRHLCGRLSWIEYHELAATGHYLSAVPGLSDTVLKTLLVEPSST